MSLPRGIRNRNPGNLRKSSVPWVGKIAGTDPEFETFDTDRNGIRATASNLLSYYDRHGLKTVRGIINRWAPPVENKTSAYVAIVAKAVGVEQDTPINVHSPETMRRLVTSIIDHENGKPPPGGWYPSNLIGAAIGDALGIVVKDEPAPQVNEPRKSMDPLSLVSILVSAFSPLLRAKVEKAVGSDVGGPLVDNLLGMATQLTGKTDPMEAVAVARQSAAVVSKLEQGAEDWFAQVAPFLDKLATYDKEAWSATIESADSAAKRGREDATDLAPYIAKQVFRMCSAALVGLVVIMGVQAWFLPTHEPTAAMLTLVGPLLGGLFVSYAAIVAYRFGEKRSSSATDANLKIMDNLTKNRTIS